MTMPPDETALAMEFLAAVGCHDFDVASALLDENAVLELPYAGAGLVRHGRAEIVRFFQQTMGSTIAQVEYRLDRAYPGPSAVVLELSTQGRTASGRDYTNRLVAIFEVRDGRIVLFREYFNPAPLTDR